MFRISHRRKRQESLTSPLKNFSAMVRLKWTAGVGYVHTDLGDNTFGCPTHTPLCFRKTVGSAGISLKCRCWVFHRYKWLATVCQLHFATFRCVPLLDADFGVCAMWKHCVLVLCRFVVFHFWMRFWAVAAAQRQ